MPSSGHGSDRGAAYMTPEEAFDAAMRYENRANPYPYFDELRKNPVVRVTNGIYAVTGYDEFILTMMEAYDRDPSFIASDPPDHDRARRQCMRFFGPPHSPDVILSQEP